VGALNAPWLRPLARGVSLLVVVCCVLPLLALILGVAGGDWTPAHAVQQSFQRTMMLTVTAATTAGVIGSILGLACARLPIRSRLPLLLLLTLPIALPTYVWALAWSAWILPVIPLGQSASLTPVAGLAPTLWVWAAAFYPLPLWATYVAVRRWNVAWSDAASVHGMPPALRTWLFVRYLMAPVGASVILVWLLLLSDFSVPDFFRVSVYGTEVFIELSSYGNVRGAIVASIPWVIVSGGLMFALSRLWRRWQVTADAVDRSGTRTHPSANDRANPHTVVAACIAIAAAMLLVLLPLMAIVNTVAGPDAFIALWPSLWRDALSSTLLSLALVGVVIPLAAVTGYSMQRGVLRRATAVRGVLAATFAVPSALLGLAGISLWNWPGTVGVVYTSGAAMVLTLVARWLPLAHELQYVAFRSVPASLEEVAWANGVPWLQSMRQVVLSSSRESLLATAILVFILTFNDLTLTALLAPPGWSTLPLRVFSTVHYGSASTLAATCLWQLVILLVPIALLAWVSHRTLARL
jgi:iron(III) transport system permease protein